MGAAICFAVIGGCFFTGLGVAFAGAVFVLLAIHDPERAASLVIMAALVTPPAKLRVAMVILAIGFGGFGLAQYSWELAALAVFAVAVAIAVRSFPWFDRRVMERLEDIKDDFRRARFPDDGVDR